MSFLAPLFLLGVLAVAGPVIFHMVRRTPKERTKFSSLMFLQATPPRAAQSSRRLQDWLLLLLRMAALILLAAAFARPFMRSLLPQETASDAEGARTVVLVDASASMKRTGLWDAAKTQAESVFKNAAPADRVALLRFSAQTAPLYSFEQWAAVSAGERAALAGAQLAAAEPDWTGTHLASALLRAAEMLAEDAGKNAGAGAGGAQIITVISDFQEGSRLEGLQGYEWLKGVRVEMLPVRSAQPGNAGLQPAAAAVLTATAEGALPAATGARVRISNAADSTRERFQAGWATADGAAFAGPAQDVYAPPGQTRVITLPWPQGPDGTPLPSGGRLLLHGDDELFDNTAFAVPPASVKMKVLTFGAEAAALEDSKHPLFFLQRALPRDRTFTAEAETVAPSAAVDAEKTKAAALYVLTDAVPKPQLEALRSAVQGGKTAVILLTNSSPALSAVLAHLAGVERAPLEEVQPSVNYAMLSEIDFRHPLFAAFADPRFNDFTKIRFWKHRRFDAAALPGSRVLAHFDSGDPAMVEIPAGAGRLVVLASGWHPQDSQLALSSKFPPLLSALLEWSGGGALTVPVQFQAGESVPLPPFRSAVAPSESLAVKRPDGVSVTLDPGSAAFAETQQPGIYQMAQGAEIRFFAVNPDAAESRTAPLTPEDLERLGVPLQSTNADKKQDAKAAGSPELSPAIEAENRQKLWRWLIAAALTVLIVETLLAGLAARRRSVISQAPATS